MASLQKRTGKVMSDTEARLTKQMAKSICGLGHKPLKELRAQ